MIAARGLKRFMISLRDRQPSAMLASSAPKGQAPVFSVRSTRVADLCAALRGRSYEVLARWLDRGPHHKPHLWVNSLVVLTGSNPPKGRYVVRSARRILLLEPPDIQELALQRGEAVGVSLAGASVSRPVRSLRTVKRTRALRELTALNGQNQLRPLVNSELEGLSCRIMR